MTRIKSSSRARGGNRGGVGGGYERTDPDYDVKRLQRMRAEYLSLDAHYREVYMKGLPPGDRAALMRLLNPQRES